MNEKAYEQIKFIRNNILLKPEFLNSRRLAEEVAKILLNRKAGLFRILITPDD